MSQAGGKSKEKEAGQAPEATSSDAQDTETPQEKAPGDDDEVPSNRINGTSYGNVNQAKEVGEVQYNKPPRRQV